MLFLIALLTGAFSAFAFAPTGLWPLMPLAVAALCEMTCRSRSLRQSLAVGWGFGVGQFVIGLNWIQFAFTFQDEMPAWLGYVAVPAAVALPRGLPDAGDRPGLAVPGEGHWRWS